MKKVLVFGITENPGGVESVIMNYYRYIDRQKIQFDFLCNTDIVAYEDEIKSLGGTIYRVTARSKDRKQFKKDMNEFFSKHSKEYSAIWVNICSLANIDYLKYAKKYGIKKRIIHAHNSQNMDSFLRGILHKWNKLFIKKYATDFWSCSDEASKWFYNNKIINSDRYLLVNNAIDYNIYRFNEEVRNKYREQMKIDKTTLVIGNVGRLHFQKNHSFIIKVFNEIHKKNKNSILFLVGDGPYKEKIKNMIKEYGLDNDIMLLGLRNDISQLMSVMDIFLFPSIFEGLPLALVEAQASRLQIFASENIDKKIVIDEEIMHFISLDESEIKWAENINKELNKEINRKIDKEKTFISKGYDIKGNTKIIEERLR